MRTDAEIVRDVLGGDRKAFAALVVRHERAAWATAWRILRDDHAAADAAQEAFLLAFRRLGGLRRPELFGVWLLRVARREAARMARERARAPSLPLDEPGPRPRATRVPPDSEALLAAVARLPEHERVVVAMHYLEGRSVSEVASALGRPVGTVTKQLSRAIGRLRLKLKGAIG